MAGEVDDIDYWLRWEVPVCAFIFAAPAVAATVLIYRVRSRPLRSVDLWIPCWRGLHPFWLLGFRAIVTVAMTCLLSRIAAAEGAFVFYFYTQWTFMLVIVYFVLATIISAHGCWTYSRCNVSQSEEGNEFLKGGMEDSNLDAETCRIDRNADDTEWHSQQKHEDNEQRAGFLGYAVQIIYQTCAGAVLLTDIVFWCVIVPFMSSDQFRLSLLMGCMHSLNLVFLLIDTALNSLQFPLFRMAYFVFWSCAYIIFQWVLHACGFSWWPYPFLELDTPWAPLWYFGMALVHIPCYGVYALAVKAKVLFFSRFFPHAFIK
ncbi:hypothetical protein QJS04_geneDACA004650 [Acorus gramineus]|uniref:Uncharacterized protein n=1 Tax=Acorus gramineus TaxID=55184 RepID=A0AAV9BSR9_ACOGR|nr:hypothetical protein QJS04_geneDACA004650 [Acorus gramineus]